MKNWIFFGVMFLAFAGMSLFSAACDDKDGDEETSPLVGYWYSEDNSEDTILYCKSDSTIMILELNYWEEKNGRYEYDPQKALLTIWLPSYTVTAEISNKTLIFTDPYDYVYRFQRITKKKYKELMAEYRQ